MNNFTSEHLQKLDEAIASGVLRVTYNGKTVEYDSLENLQKRRNMIANALNGVKKSRYAKVRMTRGMNL